MIREELARSLDHDPHFRWRGNDVTRIENLSDIVFALAMGMIVLSSQVPTTFEELQAYLLNFIPAFLSFTLLLQIWHAHFTFFRRFGVADGRIIFYNIILLFFVLFAAYPLKFAFEGFFYYLYGFVDNWEKASAMRLSFERSGYILAYFSIGYAAINLSIYMMYKHALNKANILDLSASELLITRGSAILYGCMTLLCVLVAVVCGLTPLHGFGGWLLVLNWPLSAIIKRKFEMSPNP